MGKIAFVFAGQGDQHPGMGRELAERYPAAARIFEMCDRLRPGTSQQCFSGTEDELKDTRNTQPCLFAMEMAAAAVLMDAGVEPSAVAGISLGEVVAAAAGGTFELEDGFRLVCLRGELMQREADKFDTTMAAVVKLAPERVEELCAQFEGVYPVNYNCPGQITVSGLAAQMPAFSAAVKEAGGRAIPLKVRAAFHSPFMKGAAPEFREAVLRARSGPQSAVLYSNMTGEPYTGDVAGLLSEQIYHPVLWEKIIRNMMAAGIDTFIEMGPGRTVTNIIKKIDPSANAVTYAEYLGEVGAC